MKNHKGESNGGIFFLFYWLYAIYYSFVYWGIGWGILNIFFPFSPLWDLIKFLVFKVGKIG